jgi:hypothetical protein
MDIKSLSSTQYSVIHARLRRKYGLAPECVYCDDEQKHSFQWANVSGKYTTDIEDYLPMCHHHHNLLDHGTDEARASYRKAQTGNRNGIIPILCDMGNNLIIEFESTYDAERITGISHTAINNCVKGLSKKFAGYCWSKGELV